MRLKSKPTRRSRIFEIVVRNRKSSDSSTQKPSFICISQKSLRAKTRLAMRELCAWQLTNSRKKRPVSFDQRGSAVVEFVLIATPLFIPAILFFNAMQNTAKEEMNTSFIARQAVRAFATAPDEVIGHLRIKFLLDEFGKVENEGGLSRELKHGFTYEISCSANKCLTPGSLIELRLFRSISETKGIAESQKRKTQAIARTYVDKWRSAG